MTWRMKTWKLNDPTIKIDLEKFYLPCITVGRKIQIPENSFKITSLIVQIRRFSGRTIWL